jgi:hypothetical protein
MKARMIRTLPKGRSSVNRLDGLTGRAVRPRTAVRSPVSNRQTGEAEPMRIQRRSPSRAGAAPSQLVALRDNIKAIDAHVTSIQRPVHAVQDLIGQVKAPLAFPGALHQDLTDLQRLLASLRTVVTPLSILPAPIGPASRALKQALEVLVGPPGSGSIGRTRDLAGQIDKALKPLRDLVTKIETPVKKTAETIDAMEGTIAYLRDMVAGVIARYGVQPPEDVEACAAKLNEPIARLRAALDEVASSMAELFSSLEAALRSALAVLRPLSAAIDAVRRVLDVFRGKAMQAIIKVMTRFSNAIKPYVNKAELIVKIAISRILKKLGIDANKLAAQIRRMIDALNPMKPIERAIANALAAIRQFVAKLVDASGITKLLEQLADLKRQLAQILEAFLRSPCKALLDSK